MRWPSLLLAAATAFALLAADASAFSTVVIDAGHGGHDRGGIPGQKASEKALALDLSRRVATRLRSRGIQVVMTRSGDYFVPLSQRTRIAAQHHRALFVSIHFNSSPTNPRAQGIETYYFSKYSRYLAEAIHPRLVKAAGTGDRGIRRRGFYVLRRNPLPSVLLECGFLTSPREASKASSASHRQRLADAITLGILAMR
jgi:N-acetylmuramoyl-L-alanine amidase